MGLHPAERVRAYREAGYWTDDMIDALLRERVREHGDIPAIADPLNRDALIDGPARSLTWPQLDEQVSRLAQVLLDAGIGARRRGWRPAAEHGGDRRGVPGHRSDRRDRGPVPGAVPSLGAHPPVQRRPGPAVHHGRAGSASGGRPRRSSGCGRRSVRWVRWRRSVFRHGPAGRHARARRGHRGGAGPQRAGRPPGRVLPRPERLRHDLLDLGHGEHPQGRAADPLRLAGHVHGHGGRPRPDRRRRAAQPVPDGEHGRHQRHVPALAEGGRAAGAAPSVRPGHVPAADRAVPGHLHGARRRRCSPRCCTTRRCWRRPTSPRCACSAPARRRWRPACCRAGTTSTASRSSTSTARTRASRCSARRKDIPDPAVRALYFPRYAAPRHWSFSMARTTQARIVDPETGAEITEAGVPGELHIKGPGVFPGYLPASGVPDPFDADGYLQDRRHPRDRRRRARVPALRRPVQGHGGPRRHEDLGGRDRDADLRPPEGGRRGRRRLPRRGARRADLRRRGAQPGPAGDAGRDRRRTCAASASPPSSCRNGWNCGTSCRAIPSARSSSATCATNCGIKELVQAGRIR